MKTQQSQFVGRSILRACGLVLLGVTVLGQSLLWSAPNVRAQSTGAVWGTPVTVDATGDVGEFTSLAIVDGNPAIAYRDATSSELKYVRATDAAGTTWNTPVTVDAMGVTSYQVALVIVNGNPAICYYGASNHLRYARASDTGGTTWNTPVTVDGTGNAGKHSSMAIVGGNPAISYFHGTNGDLRFVRATDVDGSTWNTPVAPDTPGNLGRYTSLAVVDGNPAISYFDFTNKDLKYVRATDTTGTAWNTPLTLDTPDDVGKFTSMAIVDGNPAISYSATTAGELKYVRASDASGSTWNTPVTVVATGSVNTALLIVDGYPAISYHSGGDLEYVRATGADGSSWATPVTADAVGDVGDYTSLAIVDGNPAISYYDVTNKDLKYVRALADSPNNVAAVPDGDCVSTINLCESVPVIFTRSDTSPALSASVTFQLSSNLQLCDVPAASIVQGPWLIGFTSQFTILDNGGGSYTVDQSITGLPCGVTTGGELFTIDVQKAGPTDGTGTITVTQVTVLDCDSAPLPGAAGAPANITIDLTAPAVLNGLTASQVKTGNDSDGTTKVTLDWIDPGVDASGVEIWRKGYGDYPEYDDGTGALPAAPITGANGWTLVNTVDPTLTTYADEPVDRDFYYYAAIVVDGCGNMSPATAITGGTLNYSLGDVVDAVAPTAVDVGDNAVNTADISLLGAHYGTVLSHGQPENILDIGPTSDSSLDALPTTDDSVDFEDLILFAINFNQVSKMLTHPAAAAFNQIVLSHGNAGVVGSSFEVEIQMQGDGQVQGLSVPLRWNRQTVRPTSYRAGDLLAKQSGVGVVLSPESGTVDAALFGLRDSGICGEGVLAVVTFTTMAAGDPGIALGKVSGRDAKNNPVSISGHADHVSVPDLPQDSELRAATPNPFNPSTTLSFSLSRPGQVKLQIYSMRGRLVRTLVNEQLAAGLYERIWDGTDGAGRTVSSGSYLVRMSAPDRTQSRQITLLK